VKRKVTFVTVMLLVLADGSKFPPHVILNHITMPTEQLHRVAVVGCQHKGWLGGRCGTEGKGMPAFMHFRDM